MEIVFKTLLEYIQSLSNQPCIVGSDLNYWITLSENKVIAQGVDVVGEGLQDVIDQHQKVDDLPKKGLFTYNNYQGDSHQIALPI